MNTVHISTNNVYPRKSRGDKTQGVPSTSKSRRNVSLSTHGSTPMGGFPLPSRSLGFGVPFSHYGGRGQSNWNWKWNQWWRVKFCVYWDGKLTGYGMFYKTYSSFKGHQMYLEDLYVSPEHRQQGIASEIVRHIAKVLAFIHSSGSFMTM